MYIANLFGLHNPNPPNCNHETWASGIKEFSKNDSENKNMKNQFLKLQKILQLLHFFQKSQYFSK
jgi:hypothetical protein